VKVGGYSYKRHGKTVRVMGISNVATVATIGKKAISPGRRTRTSESG